MKKKHRAAIALVEKEINDIWENIVDLNDGRPTFETLHEHMKLLQTFHSRISRIEKRFEASDELLRKLDPEVGNHAIGLENLETKMDKLPNRLEALESKLDSLARDVLDLRGKVARLIPPKGE